MLKGNVQKELGTQQSSWTLKGSETEVGSDCLALSPDLSQAASQSCSGGCTYLLLSS